MNINKELKIEKKIKLTLISIFKTLKVKISEDEIENIMTSNQNKRIERKILTSIKKMKNQGSMFHTPMVNAINSQITLLSFLIDIMDNVSDGLKRVSLLFLYSVTNSYKTYEELSNLFLKIDSIKLGHTFMVGRDHDIRFEVLEIKDFNTIYIHRSYDDFSESIDISLFSLLSMI